MRAIIEALRQESTWRGIIAILAGFGIFVEPGMADKMVAVAMFLIGSINVLKRD